MTSSLLMILNRKAQLRAGLTITGENFSYVLIAKVPGKSPQILQTRTGTLADMKFYSPCPVNTDLETATALLVHENLSNTTAEQWMDEHEERIIPQGLRSDQIVNEWYVDNETLVSATVLKASHDEVLDKLRKGIFSIQYLGVLLFDLSRLYSQYIEGPFIVWKLFPHQSTIGYVENGSLRGVCNFWMGSADISGATEESLNQFREVCRSLSGQKTAPRIIALADQATRAALDDIPEIGFPPGIKGIAIDCHEAYALALHEEPGLDFAPMEHSLEARAFAQSRGRALKFLRAGCTGIDCFRGRAVGR